MSRIYFLNYHYIINPSNPLQKDIYGPSLDSFKSQVSELKSKFQVIDPNKITEILNSSNNENFICFTFDDGLKEHATLVRPFLNDLNIKGLFFPCTCIFDDSIAIPQVIHYSMAILRINPLFKMIMRGITDLNIEKVNMNEFKTLKTKEKISEIKNLFKNLLKHADSIRLADYISNEGIKKYKANIIDDIHLNKDDLIKLSEDGHIIGNHTHTHPYFNGNITKNKLIEEISFSKKIIEKIINKEVLDFAFPYGIESLYDILSKDKIKNLGLLRGYTTNHDINNNETDQLQISRVSVYAKDNVQSIIRKLKINE